MLKGAAERAIMASGEIDHVLIGLVDALTTRTKKAFDDDRKRLEMLEASLLHERGYTDARISRLADRVHVLEVKFADLGGRVDTLVDDCALLRKIVTGKTGIADTDDG